MRHQVTIWNQGVFNLGHNTLESLERLLADFDFAVLVLSADDIVTSRETTQSAPRDNVIFEMGLFVGVLGSKRTFAVVDRNAKLQIPSDLAGVSVATYELHATGNDQASLGAASTTVENAIFARGRRNLRGFDRLADHQSEKEALASAISDLECVSAIKGFVGTGVMTVAFGPGSTPFYAAQRLMKSFNLHVITDNLLIIKYMCEGNAVYSRLTVMGGEWDPLNQSFGWTVGDAPPFERVPIVVEGFRAAV